MNTNQESGLSNQGMTRLQSSVSPTPKSVLKGLKSIEPTEEMPVGMRNLLRPALRVLVRGTRDHDSEPAVSVETSAFFPFSRRAPWRVPFLRRIRHEDGYRLVTVSLDADTAKMEFHWPGRRAVTAPRRPPAAHAGAIDDYRPPWFGASFHAQETAQRSPEPRLFMRNKRLKPTQIFNDQRRVLATTGWPHHCVGLITNSDGKQGSGTLVGPNLVLTASHVCPWNSINSGKGWWMTFTPHATIGSAPFGQSNVSDILWYRQVGATADSFESAEDYAALHLYSRLGDALGWMGGATYNEDWNDRNVWEIIGYPGDFGGNPAVETSQSIEDGDSPGIFGTGAGLDLETEASFVTGASGGPAWAWFQESDRQHARIVGVVSGEGFAPADLGSAIGGDTENVLAGGSEMIDLVNQARSAWP